MIKQVQIYYQVLLNQETKLFTAIIRLLFNILVGLFNTVTYYT